MSDMWQYAAEGIYKKKNIKQKQKKIIIKIIFPMNNDSFAWDGSLKNSEWIIVVLDGYD